ncbi:MAG: hypothetical protein QXW12_02265 [Nitrososphaerota archaeon]
MSGGNIIGAKYLLFVEDTDDDGTGEIYLLKDIILDGKFDEYGPGQAYDSIGVFNGNGDGKISQRV